MSYNGMGMPYPAPMFSYGGFSSGYPQQQQYGYMRPMTAGPPAQPSIYASMSVLPNTARAGPAGPSLYSSMASVPTSRRYASSSNGPSIYASTGALPFYAGHAPRAKRAAGPAIPGLTEGSSTVGLMLWPGKNGDLIITGIKEGSSVEETELSVGDVIAKVDGKTVDGMDATEVAAMLAGPTGSTVTVTTTSGVDATITRDVTAEEANATTVDSVESALRSSNSGVRQLTPHECQMFRVPYGSTIKEQAPAANSASPAAKPASAPPPAAAARPAAPTPARAAPAPARTAPAPVRAAPAPEQPQGALLTQAECSRYGVPYGSRWPAPKPKAADAGMM